MADRFDASDYIDVAARIHEFYLKYPDGRLVTRSWQVVHAGNKDFVAAEAEAYRTVDDPHPGVGIAWEPIPGPTPFTKDSELQNAETSAWGRAIVSLGFETKHIASRQEVENRQYQERTQRQPRGRTAKPSDDAEPEPADAIVLRDLEAAMRDRKIGMMWIERMLGFDPQDQADATAWWRSHGPAEVKTYTAKAAGEPEEIAAGIIAGAIALRQAAQP